MLFISTLSRDGLSLQGASMPASHPGWRHPRWVNLSAGLVVILGQCLSNYPQKCCFFPQELHRGTAKRRHLIWPIVLTSSRWLICASTPEGALVSRHPNLLQSLVPSGGQDRSLLLTVLMAVIRTSMWEAWSLSRVNVGDENLFFTEHVLPCRSQFRRRQK